MDQIVPASTVTAAARAIAKSERKLLRPEFISPADCRRTHGISRSRIYRWIASGTLPSIVIRERGRIRGIRLLKFDDVTEAVLKAAGESEQAAKESAAA